MTHRGSQRRVALFFLLALVPQGPSAQQLPCDFVGDLVIARHPLHPLGLGPLAVPADLRLTASLAAVDVVMLPQFRELCAQHRGGAACAEEFTAQLHAAVAHQCPSDDPIGLAPVAAAAAEAALPLFDKTHHGTAATAVAATAAAAAIAATTGEKAANLGPFFSAPDSAHPKVLPCNWKGTVSILVLGWQRVDVPVALAVHGGEKGAPIKSFAQLHSYLRPSLNDTCAAVADAAAGAAAAAGSLPVPSSDWAKNRARCLGEILAAVDDGIIAHCPSHEASLARAPPVALTAFDVSRASSAPRSSPSDGSRRGGGICCFGGSGGGEMVEVHVRALAGDELEHYWHFMLGELLPAVSTALQVCSRCRQKQSHADNLPPPFLVELPNV